jgi:hypothetical protein
MKKSIYALSALLFSLLCLSSKTNAGTNSTTTVTNSVCFNDGFYNWNITYTGSGGSYTATGTVNVDGTNWSVYGWGSFSSHMGTVELHAANPNGDGCQGAYVDSFTYYGSAQIVGNGSNTTFTGSGNWVNYCSGNVLFTGYWSAYGPCSSNLRTLPYGPAKNKQNTNSLTAKNSSNSVCFNDGFYNWNITYTDAGGGNYTATGNVNVDGTNWPVYGWGTFGSHMGTVELHASNPNSDGCQGAYVDSFTYYGSAQISGTGQGTTFYGSGNWVNYCSGNVLFTGYWSAYGPCATGLRNVPYGPAKHNGTNLSALAAKNTTNSVCFNDGFYNWNITYTNTGGDAYSATGTVNVDGTNWSVYGWGNFSSHMGSVELHASNPNADDCQGAYVDSFTYYGTAQISGTGSGTTFYGSGNWVNYCYGSVLFTGYWSAYGPCSSNLKSQPNGPAKHADIFSMKVSPNPVKNSSTLSYSLTKGAQVKITVFNYMQQPVQSVVDRKETAGSHNYNINASSLTSGSYRVVAIVDGKYYTYALQVAK